MAKERGVFLKQPIVYILRSLFVSYIFTGIVLFVLAFAMYKLNLSEQIVEIGISSIYILATALGGYLIGKAMKSKKYLWGFLVGFFYAAIILVTSLVVNKGMDMISVHGLSTIFLCLGGGTFGGMIS